MCGIVGLFDIRGQRNPNRDALANMNNAIRHRGPDGDGLFAQAGIGLGHRRLSIIDLSGGGQPLFNEDGTVGVVFNGEIYNYKTLTTQLESLGHLFRTLSDTEVLVHAWEEWGEQCVDRLRGIFAFAIWDKKKSVLFVARDHLGVKPLHYAFLPNGWFIFASELKGLSAHPDLDKTLDPRSIECYFGFGYVPDPRTIYNGSYKLPPGHLMTVRRGVGESKPRPYWDLAFNPDPSITLEEASTILIDRLRDSVQSQMVSDVPLGAFLSGGIDSSAVSALMTQTSVDPINAFTVSFDEQHFDETPYARQLAERYGLNHEIEQADPTSLYHLLDKVAYHHDEPFADNSALPTWLVCQMASKHVKVILSGDGGDESLAGYERYRFFMAEEKVRATLPQWMRTSLFGPMGWAYPKADNLPRMLRAKTTFQSLSMDTSAGYFHGVSLSSNDIRSRMFNSQMKSDLQGFNAVQVFRDLEKNAPEDPLSRIQYLDFKTFLAGRVLVKVDRASMAHGLEVRVPLLDHTLVSWIANLPPQFKMNDGEGKYLFKKGLKDLIPHGILNRKKQGFHIPVAEWLRKPMRKRLRSCFTDKRLAQTGLFDMDYLEVLEERHVSGKYDYHGALWSILMFDAFLKKERGER
ncbi:MAG: amidotransferase 1, exosortase A system-associated [Magnetococcales bacterium]|nr:amidotransferase 1, exosortase A system-associated [Magnetococcales bacterium]